MLSLTTLRPRRNLSVRTPLGSYHKRREASDRLGSDKYFSALILGGTNYLGVGSDLLLLKGSRAVTMDTSPIKISLNINLISSLLFISFFNHFCCLFLNQLCCLFLLHKVERYEFFCEVHEVGLLEESRPVILKAGVVDVCWEHADRLQVRVDFLIHVLLLKGSLTLFRIELGHTSL